MSGKEKSDSENGNEIVSPPVINIDDPPPPYTFPADYKPSRPPLPNEPPVVAQQPSATPSHCQIYDPPNHPSETSSTPTRVISGPGLQHDPKPHVTTGEHIAAVICSLWSSLWLSCTCCASACVDFWSDVKRKC